MSSCEHGFSKQSSLQRRGARTGSRLCSCAQTICAAPSEIFLNINSAGRSGHASSAAPHHARKYDRACDRSASAARTHRHRKVRIASWAAKKSSRRGGGRLLRRVNRCGGITGSGSSSHCRCDAITPWQLRQSGSETAAVEHRRAVVVERLHLRTARGHDTLVGVAAIAEANLRGRKALRTLHRRAVIGRIAVGEVAVELLCRRDGRSGGNENGGERDLGLGKHCSAPQFVRFSFLESCFSRLRTSRTDAPADDRELWCAATRRQSRALACDHEISEVIVNARTAGNSFSRRIDVVRKNLLTSACVTNKSHHHG